jgi:hypothetical protein
MLCLELFSANIDEGIGTVSHTKTILSLSNNVDTDANYNTTKERMNPVDCATLSTLVFERCGGTLEIVYGLCILFLNHISILSTKNIKEE